MPSILAEEHSMIERLRHDIPADHPIRTFFHQLTERGMSQQKLHDPDTIGYLTNLLTEFVQIENMYRIRNDSGQKLEYIFDMLAEAGNAMSTDVRCDCYKHLGDLTLFNLGLFPESLSYGRHTLSPDFYAAQGRKSYSLAAEMDRSRSTVVYRKLVDQFEQCVVGLNWVKLYINDPFYQYVFREFEIT
jgi:hypothetical protein